MDVAFWWLTFWWLALLVGIIVCLLIPACLVEYISRSEYRAYLDYQKSLEAQREEYVPVMRERPVHKRMAIRQGIVK